MFCGPTTLILEFTTVCSPSCDRYADSHHRLRLYMYITLTIHSLQQFPTGLETNLDFYTKKSDVFDLNQIFSFFKIRIFVPTVYQIFETGLSAQLHKQHGRLASAICSYTLVEQKVSKQQLIKVSLPWLYM